MNELFKWLQADDYNIGIFDATNTTLERRRKISALCAENKVPTLFIESICDDPIVLEQNIALKLKNADYKHTPPDIARADFLARVARVNCLIYSPLNFRIFCALCHNWKRRRRCGIILLLIFL